MKFLLNEKIKIFSLIFEEQKDGSFLEIESNLGLFYAHSRLDTIENKNILTLIIRENKIIRNDLKVIFQNKKYTVFNVIHINKNFLKLQCRR
jgi:hypothetical protein